MEADRPIPEHIALHTDEQALTRCQAVRKILLGVPMLNGRGTGGREDLGREAAELDRAILMEALSGVDIVFLVTGLGGGTGTGMAPKICEWIRQEGGAVLCFVTLPFFFEGRERRRRAEEGLCALHETADAVVCLPNQRMIEWAGETDALQEVFAQVNSMLLNNLFAVADLLQRPGIMNVTFNDLRTLLEHSKGACSIGYGEGRGPQRMEQALDQLVDNPILGRENAVRKAGGLLVGVVGSASLRLAEIQKIMEVIPAQAPTDVHLYMGAAVAPEWEDRLGIVILAAEKWVPPERESKAETTGAADEAAAALLQEDADTDTPAIRRRRRRNVQTKLTLEPTGKGRFDKVEPTLFQGEDLDIPTFLRRKIKLTQG
jgi:cell division protein FtsZ